MALVGGYGNGKTHILRYIKHHMNHQFSRNYKARAIAGYVITPGRSLVDTYRSFMQDLGRNFFIQLTWELLGKVALSRISQGDEDYRNLEGDIETSLAEDPSRIRKYVEDGTIPQPSLMKHARKALSPLVTNIDVANCLLKLLAGQTTFLAWRWLSGEPILQEQRRKLKIISPIDGDDKALSVFQDIRGIMRELGYQLVCMLIDEFELVEVLHHTQKQRFLNSIRHLIDLNPSGLCLIISCTPEVWKDIFMKYHAFSERILREVPLKPLNQETIKTLIQEHLNLHRTEPIKEPDPMYPFTQEAITHILQASQGNVRRALALCNIAIDLGIKQGDEWITPQTIRQIAR
ncbi:MAG: hypothetical protein AOA65_1638 [Candidatus Bathyarchaeota archaeon BA1]|nr:MAG: hypothetical protein AOA65_1638 [Candidatus Bathyarchaeota archaeon BA1]